MGIREWLNGHVLPLESLPSGGRKTTGYAQTEPLQVLYNGLREFIVLSVTHLYDWANANEDGVVQHPCSKTPLFRLHKKQNIFVSLLQHSHDV